MGLHGVLQGYLYLLLVGIAMDWTAGFRFPTEAGIFLYSTASSPALRPTQPPNQLVAAAVSPEVKGPSVKLTTHPHLVPRSRIVDLCLHSLIRLHGIVRN
jgi:hypothetical protein